MTDTPETIMARALREANGKPFETLMRERIAVDAAIKALEDEGFVIVPVEPTEAMVLVGSKAIGGGDMGPGTSLRSKLAVGMKDYYPDNYSGALKCAAWATKGAAKVAWWSMIQEVQAQAIAQSAKE